MKLDHIAIAATSLAEGVAYVEETLGMAMQNGGNHPRFGTHNYLLGLGEDLYLEVIAIDPDAALPLEPRWFDLDNFSGPPRLVNWICSTKDIAAALQEAPPEAGRAIELKRDELRWKMSVPEDGGLPYGGAFPTFIEWGRGVASPAQSLTDHGARLLQLTVQAPVISALAQFQRDKRIILKESNKISMEAQIQTPNGIRVLR